MPMEVVTIGTTWLIGSKEIASRINGRLAGTGIKVDASGGGREPYSLTVEGISRRQVDRLIGLIRAELGRETQ
jgi:hypothetical protein